jgi:hypothetical protein
MIKSACAVLSITINFEMGSEYFAQLSAADRISPFFQKRKKNVSG